MTRPADFDEVAVAHVVAGVPMRLTRTDDILEVCRRLAARGTLTMEQAAELMGQTRDRLAGVCNRYGVAWPRATYPLDWVHAYSRGGRRPPEDRRTALEARVKSMGLGVGDAIRVKRSDNDSTYVATIHAIDTNGVTVRVRAPLSRGYRERWDAPAHYPMDRSVQVPWWRVVDVVRRAAA